MPRQVASRSTTRSASSTTRPATTRGVVDQYAIHRLQGVAVPVDTSEVVGARPMTVADLADVVEMDAATLGVARGPLIRSLFEAGPAGCWVVEDDAGLAAWSFRRPGARRWHIGPVGARHHRLVPGDRPLHGVAAGHAVPAGRLTAALSAAAG